MGLDSLLEVPEIDTIINTDAKEILSKNGLTSDDRILIRQRPEEICGDDIHEPSDRDDVKNVPAEVYLMNL